MSRYDRSDDDFSRTRSGYVPPVPAPARSGPREYSVTSVRAGFRGPPNGARLMHAATGVTGKATGELLPHSATIVVRVTAPPRREGAMAPGRAHWKLRNVLRQYVPGGCYLPVGLPSDMPGRAYARAADDTHCGYETIRRGPTHLEGSCILKKGHEGICEIGAWRPPTLAELDGSLAELIGVEKLWEEEGKTIDTRGSTLTSKDMRDLRNSLSAGVAAGEYGDDEMGPGYPR